MRSLHELQALFRDWIHSGVPDETLLAEISGDADFSALERIQVYRRNYLSGLEKALKDSYPACVSLVGEKYFSQLALDYIAKNPSVNPDLNFYGECFADYLQEVVSTRVEAASLSYLPDVARLEWCRSECYYAPDEKSFDMNALGDIAEEMRGSIVFTLSSSLRLFASSFPVLKIWTIALDGVSNESEEQIDLESGRECLCIVRRDRLVRIDQVDQFHWELLNSIASQLEFGALCQRYQSADYSDRFAAAIPDFIARGYFSGFTTASSFVSIDGARKSELG